MEKNKGVLKSKRYIAIVILTIVAMISFGTVTTEAKTVNSLSNTSVRKSLTLVVNEKKKLQVKSAPTKAKITYRSANKRIASINKNGTITGKKAGKTTITARITYRKRTVSRRCQVTVKHASAVNKIYLQIGKRKLTASLEKNSSVTALVRRLAKGPITIELEDFAEMEKSGELPRSLPTNDIETDAEAGDLMLYEGITFVIYYEENTWELTRLGKINNITKRELIDLLGEGNVTVKLSL